MKLNPTEAPIYGQCVLTVELDDNDTCPSPEEEGEGEEVVEFYLFFSGSSQRHLTSTVRVSHVTLQAVCPGHNVCEQVLVVLCVARPNGAVISCSQENFTFVQDLALDTAQLMLSSTLHQKTALGNDQKECKKLDESLILALKHLSQLHSLGLCSSALPHTHLPRQDLPQTLTGYHENITQDQRLSAAVEGSSEKEPGTDGSSQQQNCLSGQQQLLGLLHLAGDDVNRTSPFIPEWPAQTGAGRSGSDRGPSTDCEDTSRDHLQRLLPFTRSEAVTLNEDFCVDPYGQVFQHHSKLGTFTLTIPSIHKRQDKSDSDFCLQDGVAQLRRLIAQYKGKKRKDECGTASPSTCGNAVNSAPPANEEIVDVYCLNPPQENHLENASAVSVEPVCQSQETGAIQTARTGRNRRNKKRTTKTARTMTENHGSPLVAAEGTASKTLRDTKALLSTEQAGEITLTEKDSKEDLSQMPTSPDSDEQNSSRKSEALPATAIVEKQEEQKWEVEQILLDQVTQNVVTELGLVEDRNTKECLDIPHQEATAREETMGQDQSQPCPDEQLEASAHEEMVPPKTDDVTTTASEGAAWDQEDNSDSVMKEEPKSQTIWYDSEQLDMREDADWSSPQLSTEPCASPRQLSPTLTQPHATGPQPALSHGPASQRQEVLGSQQDEEAGPDWEKASGEEVSAHSKRSSENDEDGHGDRGAKSRKKKRKKRGKRGGIDRKQLSSTSSVESQSQTENQTQVNDQDIQDKTGKTDIVAISVSVTDTMHLPNQAETQDESRDGTNLVALESNTTDLSGTTDFNILGELAEDKTTIFNESDELIWDATSTQTEVMDMREIETLETTQSQVEKRELLLDSVVLDCNGEVTVDHPCENSPTQLPASSPDQEKSNKMSLPHFDDKLTQMADPLVESPKSDEPVGAFHSPVDGTADVPPLQTREGSAEITAEGPSGHCLAADMPGHQSLKEENKNELWKEEETKIEGLQRREVMELCSNNVAGVGEGPCLGSGLELAATAVAVVTVAVASAMAKLELSQHLAEVCTETPGINPLFEQVTDETLAPCNEASRPVNTSPFTQDNNKWQAHCESQTAEMQIELNVDFAQEMDSNGNQPDGTNQAVTQETDIDLPNEKIGLHQTIQAASTDKHQDSSNEELFVLRGNEQMKFNLTLGEDHIDAFDNECIGVLTSNANQNTCVALPEVVSDKSPDACPVLDTGQGGQLIPLEDITEELSLVEIPMDANEEAVEGCLMLETQRRKDSLDTSTSQPKNVQLTEDEQMVPLSCDSPSSTAITHESSHCPVENVFVEPEVRREELKKDFQDEIIMEIKSDALESQDQGEDAVDGWRERERARDDNKNTEAGTGSVEQEESASKRSVMDCLQALWIQRETDVFCPVQHCPDLSSQPAIPEDNKKGSLVCLQEEDVIPDTAGAQDSVFKEPPTTDSDQKVRVSWSSTDDASSVLGTYSEEPSISTSDANTSRLSWKSEAEDTGLGEMEGVEEEEKKDLLPISIVASAILRANCRSLSPSRRHSWEPGKNDLPSNMGQSSPLTSTSEEARPAKTPIHRRSMSWCPSNLAAPGPEPLDNRSCSLEGLEEMEQSPGLSDHGERGQEQDCYTEEDQQSCHPVLSLTSSCPGMFHHQTLTKSVSMVAISHRDIDAFGCLRSKRRISFSISISPLLSKNRRFISLGSSSSDEDEIGGSSSSVVCNSVECSISEEEPGPLRSSAEVKGGPRISRTFSYLKNKMTKKGKEKEKDRKGEKEREPKERDKKTPHGHVFVPVCPSASSCCSHCHKMLQTKECLFCKDCGIHTHKSCKDSVAVCVKSKNKLQVMAPDTAPPSATARTKSTSSTGSTVSSVSLSSRERWSTATTPEDHFPPVLLSKRITPGNLSKSISTSNIAGLDDVTLKSLKVRSQSTDSLNQNSAVSASTESLTDEGTEMMDNQLMGEFEWDIKDLEADSWSSTVDKKFLKTLKKDEIKRQDVIYELYQTEVHHMRTLRIMSEVYHKGIQNELQLDHQIVEKIFPMMDDLVEIHTEFLNLLLEQKRCSSVEGHHGSFLICSIGDTLVKQFSESRAERMKRVYGKFCSRHNEAVNLYKDLHTKDKRFQSYIKRLMSSAIVRRLSIPECILLVTQRITKYPVLIQRILQHTKEADLDHICVSEALQLVKEIITAVDSKVNEQEKKRRLKEVYSRTDSKSIMRMKSGQMFAKEDLLRGRRLLHDGALQLKNSAGRLKDVHALLMSDVLVFLQEKDQKYVFASLDQRSTVISLQNLIVREVANEERGLFLLTLTARIEKPEMVEVLASSKEERNSWRAIIQDAMQSMEKDEDEGIPSETEEDKRQQESRMKEIRELLRSKDEQIVSLLEEKVLIFRELSDCSAALYDACPAVRERMLFRATPDDVTKGEPIIREALKEVDSLQSIVNSGLGGAACSVSLSPAGGGVGPVSLPRRAETFGGFDSHQMSISKNGEKEEADESVDLRRTESDGVLKKGATASLQLLLKRNNEVLSSVNHLHDLLLSLQAVVVQQDSFIEDQRQTLNERLMASSSRHSSSSSLSSASSSRPSSLIEQEKHRSLERQRQEAASLQKQQAAHLEEKRRREREWELRDSALCEREEKLKEEEAHGDERRRELLEERERLQKNKELYHKDLERLREAQIRLERDKEALRRDTERLEAQHKEQAEQLQRYSRTSSITSEDSVRFPSTSSLDLDCREAEQQKEVELSTSAPTKEPFLRIGSKRMGKNFNPFASSSSKTQGAEKEPSRLLQLTKPKKDKKDKKKKKGDTLPAGSSAVFSDFQKDDNFSS